MEALYMAKKGFFSRLFGGHKNDEGPSKDSQNKTAASKKEATAHKSNKTDQSQKNKQKVAKTSSKKDNEHESEAHSQSKEKGNSSTKHKDAKENPKTTVQAQNDKSQSEFQAPMVLTRPIIVSFICGKQKVANDFVFTGKMGQQLTIKDLPHIPGYKLADNVKVKGSINQHSQHVQVPMVKTRVTYQLVPVDEEGQVIDDNLIETRQGQPGAVIPVQRLPKIPGYQASVGRKYHVKKDMVKVTYAAEQQSLTIEFLTTKGQPLDELTLHGKTGASYHIKLQDHQFEGYELTSAPENLSGVFEAGKQSLEIKYTPIESTITVNFLDESGNDLRHPLIYTGKYGENYNLKDEGLPVIDGYELDSDPSLLLGTYEAATKTIALTFKRTRQEFKVHYWFNKKQRKSAADDLPVRGLTGDFYQVIPPKIDGYTAQPEEITGRFDPFKNPDIDVVYQRSKAILQVNFEDESGRVLKQLHPLKKEGHIGGHYKVHLPLLEGYKQPKDFISGQFKQKQQTIVVYYQATATTVTVRYLDTKTGRTITNQTDQVLKGPVGTAYNVEPKMINGYSLSALPDNASGIFHTKKQTVVLRYQPNKSKVIVECRDKANRKLLKPIELDGYFGQQYHIDRQVLQQVEGYSLDQNQKLTGTFPANQKVIKLRFVADPIAFKIVAVDQYGHVINHKYDIKVSGLPGQKFSHGLPQIPGYTSKASDVGDTIRPKMNGRQIKIAYTPNAASVIFHFLCQGGPHDHVNPYPDYELPGRTGDPYEYEVPNVEGYEATQPVYKGKFKSTTQHQDVTYNVLTEDYTINFIDRQGEVVDRTPVSHGEYGQEVNIADGIPDGYHLPAGADKAVLLNGQSTYEVQIIPDTILVQMVAQTENGQDLNYQRQVSGEFNQPQELKAPLIAGYQPVDGPNVRIAFDNKTKIVPVVYAPIERQITIRFIDTQGNSLREPQVVKGHYGQHYRLKAPKLDSFVTVGDEEKDGTFGLNNTETAFIYRAGSDDLNRAITPLSELVATNDQNQNATTSENQQQSVNAGAFVTDADEYDGPNQQDDNDEPLFTANPAGTVRVEPLNEANTNQSHRQSDDQQHSHKGGAAFEVLSDD